MPKVLNRRHLPKFELPPNAVYVGRPSKWGNPYAIGDDGNRDEVIEKFRKYITSSPKLLDQARSELRGKDLVCWCAPARCHAEVLMEIANGEEGKDQGQAKDGSR